MKLECNKKILICGIGSIGQKHLSILRDYFSEIDLFALRSQSSHGGDVNRNFKKVFHSFESSLSVKPDGVIISTPASLHYQHAYYFSSHNIPILLEKPIGTGFETITSWIELKKLESRTPILVGYFLRHHPTIKLIRDQLLHQRLGKVLEADFYCGSWLPNWRKEKNYKSSVSALQSLGGGVLNEVSHEIDLANYLFDELKVVGSVLGKSSTLNIETESIATILATSNTCSVVTIRLNFCSLPPKRIITIRGEKGEIECDLLKGVVITRSANDEEVCEFSSDYNAIYLEQMRHFLACINHQELPICTLDDGLKVLKTIKLVKML